ncbi:VOC family protein [Paenibacillus thermotolerans]|uniref:VOC family protein n=1 Tax=Paenibacillus thermotolerans TaxID=3027807 RepID=UPI002368B545|nr:MULTISPECIES: VOC family protein [unclassified Paenibacillus]
MIDRILYNEIPVKNIPTSAAWFKTDDDTQANFTVNGKKHNVIGFQTADIEKLYSHLKLHAVVTEPIVDDGEGNAFLNFFDLDGNMFNVQCDRSK